jgi:uncharacterized protein (DUF1501 family)
MWDIPGGGLIRDAEGVRRRDFLRVGAASLLGLSWADGLRLKAAGAGPTGRARSVIQLWMGGGPSQLDTFDPKPTAGEAYTGPLRRPIATNVPGLFLSELLPKLATQADKFALLRGMTHGNNSHETATYMMMTCTMPSAETVYPVLGAVVAQQRPPAGELPPYVTLTQPLGRISESGFLGANARSFATGGDPNAKEFRVQGIGLPRGLSAGQLQERKALAKALDTLARDLDQEPAFRAMDEHAHQAERLMVGAAREAFDLSREPDALRDRYGRTTFGQSCLLARRLVEAGVPFITINMGGWDTHRDNFGAMKKLLPTLDAGFATLLEDLAARGLLDSTAVVWYGEFGRTPKVYAEPPWFGGRHHFGPVFSAVVAGGGFAGGQVVGSSDARGEAVKDRPTYPWDLSASLYRLLGIDPMGRLPHPQGCVAYVTPLGAGDVPSGGLLDEIM